MPEGEGWKWLLDAGGRGGELVIGTDNFANNQRLRFFEMCAYLENLGFRVPDVAAPDLRPYDDLFWQIDLVLLPANHEIFSYTGCE